MSKKVKIFVTVIVIIAVLIVIFSYIGNRSPAASSSTSLSVSVPSQSNATLPSGGTGDPSQATASQFSATLSNINHIALDTSIFSDPGYKALRDYPVALGTAVIGRQNPFAPLGSDSSVTSAPTLQVQILTPGKVVSASAELGALVTVNNTSPVSVVFQYGTTDTFGTASAPVMVSKSGTALFTAQGLTPGTTYYVEAVAVQGSTTATSTIISFTTATKG
jgi:hypothetical protein